MRGLRHRPVVRLIGAIITVSSGVLWASPARATTIPPNPVTPLLSPCSSPDLEADCGDHRITVVGDLDGDGRPDVVSEHEQTTLMGDVRRVYQGRRGSDGTVLWSYDAEVPRLNVQTVFPGRVGQPSAEGVILSWETQTAAGYLAGLTGPTGPPQYATNLVALNASGEEVWTRTVPHLGQDDNALVGTFTAVSGSATDLLLTINPVTSPPPPPERNLIVVDGRDGSIASQVTYPIPPGATLDVATTTDLTGDGLEDMLVASYPMQADPVIYAQFRVAPGTVTARQGTDQVAIWTNSVVPGAVPHVVDDVTGDGRPDLAGIALTPHGPGMASDSGAYLLDGVTGSLVWNHVVSNPDGGCYTWADSAFVWGDVEAAGQQDAGDARVQLFNGVFTVTYTSYRPDGSAVYETSYTLPLDSTGSGYTYDVGPSGPVGDVDGDGVTDAAHDIATYSYSSHSWSYEQGMVDGRTGAKRWSGPAGRAVGATIDGTGDDLVRVLDMYNSNATVIAQDGATGAPIWSTSLGSAAPGGVTTVGEDVTGDGRAEVILRQQFTNGEWDHPPTGPSNWVLDGATGQILWSF